MCIGGPYKNCCKSQNFQIIGGSNPNASFQSENEAIYHVVCFLCNLHEHVIVLLVMYVRLQCKGIPLLLSVVGATSLGETQQTYNGRLEWLVFIEHLPQEIAEICYFFTKHDDQLQSIGKVMGHRVHCTRVLYIYRRCRILAIKSLVIE